MKSLKQIENEEVRYGALADLFFKAFVHTAEHGRIYAGFQEMHRRYSGRSLSLGREYLQRKYLRSA